MTSFPATVAPVTLGTSMMTSWGKLMSRGAHSFRHGDIAKVVKAVVKAGVSVKRVEIANGRIMMFAGEPEAGEPEEAAAPQIDVDANEWDSVQ